MTEAGVRIIRAEQREAVQESAALLAEERLVELLVPEKKKTGGMQNPFEMLFGQKDRTR